MLTRYALLLSICALQVAAQTRLDSSQVAPLQGDVKGSFANTVLRDYNSAIDHGNGVSNAIYSAIQDCGTVNACGILVPANYPATEAVPGYQLNYALHSAPATTPGNIAIFDRRYGEARTFVNNNGYPSGLLEAPTAWLYNYYSKEPRGAEMASSWIKQWSLDGGNNQQNSGLGYADKTVWATTISNDISHSPGQHLGLGLGPQSTAIGNTMGLNNTVTCYGGFNAQGDLGCHAMDNIVAMGTVEYSGTLAGAPTTGGSSVTVSASQGEGTQGAGRYLVKTNAGTISLGTISAVTTNYGVPAVVTGSGTPWPVSTVIGQLGTNVTAPGVATVTPASFTVGSVGSLGTNSLVCVADQEAFEMIYPTTITSTTITAKFAKIHPSSAVIASGGVCGYLLDLTADDVTNLTYPVKSQTITGTLHFAWPLIYSTSATSAALVVTGDGVWQQLTTKWNASRANGYVMYPFAEVMSTQQAGGLSDTLTLGPNNVAWASGDSVSELIYPAVHYTFGNTIIESYYPNIGGSTGFGLTYNMPLQGSDAMMSMVNNGPTSLYFSGGGNFFAPHAINLKGPTSKTLQVDIPGDTATIGVGCPSQCYSTANIIAAGNASYYDFLMYDQSNKRFELSANSNSKRYYWAANQFSTPFTNVWMTSDSNGRGYVVTQQSRTNSATNTDFSGELDFSSASSMSQTFQGTYGTHPECTARTEFDPGSGNRFWITYTATSFTVNFASAVTGVVTYSCAGRN